MCNPTNVCEYEALAEEIASLLLPPLRCPHPPITRSPCKTLPIPERAFVKRSNVYPSLRLMGVCAVESRPCSLDYCVHFQSMPWLKIISEKTQAVKIWERVRGKTIVNLDVLLL